jgi:predicted membrane protein
VKIMILLAFTLAAYNLEIIRSFVARKTVVEEEAKKPRKRKKRRKETWRDVVAVRPATGPDPPPS